MNELQTNKKPSLLYLLILINGAAYYWLCYQTRRENFFQVFGLFTLLFTCYYFIYTSFTFQFKKLVAAGIFFRILLLFSVPNLSDDVYRFIWDGRLMANGINPYSQLPKEVISLSPVPGITNALQPVKFAFLLYHLSSCVANYFLAYCKSIS